MKYIGKLSSFLASISLVLLVILTNIAVFDRKILDAPITWTEEASGFLLTWIIAMGIIVAEQENYHLSIPIVVDLFPPRVTAILNSFADLVGVFIVLCLAYLALHLAQDTSNVTNLLQISSFYFYIPFAISGLCIALFTLQRLYNLVMAFKNEPQVVNKTTAVGE